MLKDILSVLAEALGRRGNDETRQGIEDHGDRGSAWAARRHLHWRCHTPHEVTMVETTLAHRVMQEYSATRNGEGEGEDHLLTLLF
jgi:hypothetical protein